MNNLKNSYNFNSTTTSTTSKSITPFKITTIKVAATTLPETKENTKSRLSLSSSSKVRSFFQSYGYIIAAVAISLTGAVVITLVSVVRCLLATRRASRALALPIPLLPEDRTPLNAEPEHPVPMLSVQTAGCAGMERLGVPARTSLSSPPDDRGHISRRMRVDAIQARDILVRDATILSDRQVRNNHHHHYHRTGCGNGRGIETSGHSDVIRCPHHVPLPDSEWGQDRDLQIRTRYQQAEITRSYIKPPPNKTVLDVPEQSYNLFSSSSLSSSLGMTASSCNLGHNYNNQHSNHQTQQNQQHQHQQQQQQQQQKSKPNVITKFFSRKSSPKSPSSSTSSTAVVSTSTSFSSSSSVSSSSSSSSSSSLSSSLLALPITTATALTTTNCSLGTNVGPLVTLTLSGISVTSVPTGSSGTVPTSASAATAVQSSSTTTTGPSINTTNQFHHHQQQQQHYHQTHISSGPNISAASAAQQQVTGSSNNLSQTMHSYQNASHTLSSSSLSSIGSSSSSSAISSLPSTDCCYLQATSIRSRTPNQINSSSGNVVLTGSGGSGSMLAMTTTTGMDGTSLPSSNNNIQTDGASNNNHQLQRDHI